MDRWRDEIYFKHSKKKPWMKNSCRLLSCNRRFGGTYRLHLQGRRNNLSKNQQVIGWQASWRWRPCSSETSFATRQTTRRHNDTLHNHHCEDLKSYKPMDCYVDKWVCGRMNIVAQVDRYLHVWTATEMDTQIYICTHTQTNATHMYIQMHSIHFQARCIIP
jgi:hypothetical protein